MAQSNPYERIQETHLKNDDNNKDTTSGVPFKFNAQAPEFVPGSHTQMPVSGYFYPYFQYLGGGSSGSDWIYLGGDQDSFHLVSSTPNVLISNYSTDVPSEDLQQKIIRQVLFYAVFWL